MRASFLDLGTLASVDLNLQPLKEVSSYWQLHDSTTPEQVSRHLQGAQIAISNKVILDAQTLQQCPELRLILVAATGTNNVDLDYCHQHKIQVRNCQSYGTNSIAQHALALMLALANRIPANNQAAYNMWPHASNFCLLENQPLELTGKTLGLIGYGTIGQRVAELAQAIGLNVIIAERKGTTPRSGRVAFEQVIQQADIISLHCPLDSETLNLINTAELNTMKNHALLINTARGGVVHEQALVKALESGQIAGAACDVLSQEPPPANHPLLQCQHPNLILSPHMAWGGQIARQTIIHQLAENIVDYVSGGSLRRVV